MKLRVLTGLVLAPLAFWVVGWAPEWLFLLVLLLVVGRAMYEYILLSRQAGFKTVPAVGYAGAGGLCLAQSAELHWPGTLGPAMLMVLALSLIVTLAVGLRWPGEPRHFFPAAASTGFGILYIGFALSFLVPLRFSPAAGGRDLILLLFLVNWAGDAFAYFVGRAMGRTPLTPVISPKKTVEGSLAGLGGSLIVAWVFAHWFWPAEPMAAVMLYAGIIAVVGQVGDLVESAMKRAGDVKDSGTLLPGHGGLLDRIDSLILAAPALWMAVVLGRLVKTT